MTDHRHVEKSKNVVIMDIINSLLQTGNKCENFRGIAIGPIISTLFEYCFIEKFGDFLSTDNKQFGFRKGMGCNHAIFTAR